MYRAIIAPKQIDVVRPIVFLVGPIANAPNWQVEATRLLLPYANVLNPRRQHTGKPFLLLSQEEKEEQRQWEFAGQEKADVIVVWLANANNPEGQRIIGRDSRTELGVHIGSGRRVAVGIEPGFSGEHWLQSFCKHHNYPVHSTLLQTCRRAIRFLGFLQGLR